MMVIFMWYNVSADGVFVLLLKKNEWRSQHHHNVVFVPYNYCLSVFPYQDRDNILDTVS